MAPSPEDTHAPRSVVQTTALWKPKRGHSEEEYEDAYAVSETEAFPVSAAVTDGATEAAFARRWARILADGVAERDVTDEIAFRACLPAWQAQWAQSVAGQAPQRPWYAAAKAEQGAFAALLGLTLEANGSWRALSIGDCALIQLRGDAFHVAWPIDNPDAFASRPALVPSRAAHAVPRPDEVKGRWKPDDTFLLASDALAAWLLRVGPTVARSLDAETFAEQVCTAREDGDLRNDDVTLLKVDLRAA